MSLAQPNQVRIYNRALALLGSVTKVVNTDDGQAVTDLLNSLWPDAVRELLAEHPWNGCVKRAVLNISGDTPPFGDSRYFNLPPDCLRWLPWSSSDPEFFIGDEEAGKRILAQADSAIRIRYIAEVAEPGAWSPHMVTAMGHLLAWHAAEPVTQSASIATAMRILYQGEDGDGGSLAKAREKDGLATGSRTRGMVETRSRALRAARVARY